MIDPTNLEIIKIFVPAIFSFTAGLLFAPAWVTILQNNKMYKKSAKTLTVTGEEATVFNALHAGNETSTPRMGGVVIWASTITISLLLWALSQALPNNQLLSQLDLISRSQTWIPLFTLLLGATIGLIDDYFEVSERSDHYAGGLSLKKRLLAVGLIGLFWGIWFYAKLDMTAIVVPFLDEIFLGPLLIPLFVIVMIGTYAGGVIDGIDGLSGGVFASIFASYGVIAMLQNQFNIAALCFVLVGSILAFLWFNLPPAKYYMTETGSMALTLTLTVIAFQTNQVLLLPIIAMPLLVTPLSNIVQLIYKKRYKKKLFHITPIHHHFEALGYPSPQIVMKYWIVSIICGLSGIVLALLG